MRFGKYTIDARVFVLFGPVLFLDRVDCSLDQWKGKRHCILHLKTGAEMLDTATMLEELQRRERRRGRLEVDLEMLRSSSSRLVVESESESANQSRGESS